MAYTTFLPLIIALLASLLLVPVIRWFSFRINQVAIPRTDRWHRQPTPTLGGIGIFIAFAASLMVVWLTNTDHILFSERWSILLAIVIMFSIGLYDDFKHINPPIKLAFQILAATLVIFLAVIPSTSFVGR